MKRIVIGAIVLGILTGPALAQVQSQGMSDDPLVLDQQMKKKNAEAIDREYKTTLQKTNPDKAATRVDPWQNMRAPSTSAKR